MTAQFITSSLQLNSLPAHLLIVGQLVVAGQHTAVLHISLSLSYHSSAQCSTAPCCSAHLLATYCCSSQCISQLIAAQPCQSLSPFAEGPLLLCACWTPGVAERGPINSVPSVRSFVRPVSDLRNRSFNFFEILHGDKGP